MNTEFIKGSEGKFDYAVVSSKGAIRLGIKPIIHDCGLRPDGHHAGVFIGLRIRSADGTGARAGAEKLTGSWPSITFTQVNDVRASAMLGSAVDKEMLVNATQFFAAHVERDLTRKLFDLLVSSNAGPAGGWGALRAVICEQFQPLLLKYNNIAAHVALEQKGYCLVH